jgi:hypothetical protein
MDVEGFGKMWKDPSNRSDQCEAEAYRHDRSEGR